MKFKRILALLLTLLLLCASISPSVASSEPPSPAPTATPSPTPEPTPHPYTAPYSGLPEVDIRAEAALLADADTGNLLYQKNIHVPREPASLTKVMTCMLALENIDWESQKNDIVTVTADIFDDITSDSSTSNLKIGEELRLEDLLYCVMLQSANEACNLLGQYISGSVADFVALMNQRGEELGLEGTHFVNPHGLPAPGHETTAHDMYLIILQALKTPHFMEIAHTDSYVVPPTNKTTAPRRLTTTNSLISTSRYSEYIYPPAKGIKTGHTQAAGYCLTSTAEKDNLHLISIVLGASLEDGKIRSFVETKLLFEWGFANFSTRRILSKNEVLREIPVIRGVGKDAVTVIPENEILALVPKSLDISKIERKVTLTSPQALYAPVYKHEVLGTVTLELDGHVYGSVNLLASFDVQEDTTAKVVDDLKVWFSQPWIKWVIISTVSLIALYVLFVLLLNTHRKKRRTHARPSNYNGRKRR